MKTLDEIYSEMTALFQQETGVALAGDGDMAVRLYTAAAQIYALYIQADWVERQCFPQTAQGEYLDKHAQLRGLERREAAAAQGVLRFEVDSPAAADLTIPAGTVCMTAGLVSVDVSVAVAAGEGADGAVVRAAVEQAVSGWFNGGLLGHSVLRAELGALVFGVDGAANYELTAPAADVSVGKAQLPVLGTLTVTAMEETA